MAATDFAPQNGQSTVLDRPISKKSVQGLQRPGGWELRILDDDFNTRDFIAASLVRVTGLDERSAYSTMMAAHKNGSAPVGVWPRERVEAFADQFTVKGIGIILQPV